MNIFKFALIPVLTTLLVSCGGGSGGGGGSSDAGNTNKFSTSGTPITIDKMTSTTRGLSSLAVQTYYGRVLYKSGSNLYGASIHFDLNKNDSTSAYFSNFYIDRLVQLTAYNSATAVVTSATNTNVTASYNASTNSITIANATSRFVNFNVDFGDNTHFSDVTNAGVIFSSDFTTMVGGNNSSFFFIAQKASSMGAVAGADVQATWNLANFTVNGSGTINIPSTATVAVSGTGGHSLIAFKGTNSLNSSFQGETALTDSGTGVFTFGFDTGSHTIPTADGYIDGVFLLSPDKNFILGYNVTGGMYFAASK